MSFYKLYPNSNTYIENNYGNNINVVIPIILAKNNTNAIDDIQILKNNYDYWYDIIQNYRHSLKENQSYLTLYNENQKKLDKLINKINKYKKQGFEPNKNVKKQKDELVQYKNDYNLKLEQLKNDKSQYKQAFVRLITNMDVDPENELNQAQYQQNTKNGLDLVQSSLINADFINDDSAEDVISNPEIYKTPEAWNNVVHTPFGQTILYYWLIRKGWKNLNDEIDTSHNILTDDNTTVIANKINKLD